MGKNPTNHADVPYWRDKGPLTGEKLREREEYERIVKLCDKRDNIKFAVRMVVFAIAVVSLILYFIY